MRKILGSIVALLACLTLSGCETMSPDECRLTNWNDIGVRDGASGKTLGLLDQRIKDCAKAGVAGDTRSYLAGRDAGLQNYCRLENAVPLGLNGTAYAGVCPAMIDAEFRRRHEAGYAVHELRERVHDLDERGDSLENRLRDADREEQKQLKASDKEDDRKRIRKDFEERRRHLRHELGELDRAMRHARDALREAEFNLDSVR